MKHLTIQSTRKLEDKDWELFKAFYAENKIIIDWNELETTGKTSLTAHEDGEDVITRFELKEV